jgi:ATP-dependent DNA ligase
LGKEKWRSGRALPGTVLGGARASDGEHKDGEVVFRHACKLGFEGIVCKRKRSPYRSGRSPDWLKTKNPAAPGVKREAEEDWAAQD